MLRTAVKAKQSPLRCPFCHDQVDLQTPWVVCRGCLARHHSECWAMNSACAGCHERAFLRDVMGTTVSRSARVSSEALAVLDQLGRGRSLLAPFKSAGFYLSSVLSAGLVPLLVAEATLRHHVRQHRAQECDCSKSTSRCSESPSRSHVLITTYRRSRDRSKVASVVFALCAILAIIAAFVHSGRHVSDLGRFANVALVVSPIVWVGTLLAVLVGHHRAVRRHDASQMAFTARAEGWSRERAKHLAAVHEDAWTSTAARLGRGTGFAVFLSTICFPIAYVTFPLWLTRAFQIPLEVHVHRETLGDLG